MDLRGRKLHTGPNLNLNAMKEKNKDYEAIRISLPHNPMYLGHFRF